MRSEITRYPGLSVDYVDHHNPDLLLFDRSGDEMSRIDLTRIKTQANLHRLLNLLGVRERCIDDSADCPGWAKSGQCDVNRAYMHTSCRLSCGMCTPDNNPDAEPPCRNSSPDRDCEYWSTMGECDANADFMRTACARSCGVCTVKEVRSDELDDDGDSKDEL